MTYGVCHSGYSGALTTTTEITVRSVAGEPYERIIDYELGDA